ncbi:MAG: hypothetical protein P1V51_11210 [Deltaproteobacteria bacterium]|nr:hypothetical protein [Deltaproteobacteria bacterium]
MSIVVQAFERDEETGERRPVRALPAPPHDELVGIEATRHALWGSELMRSLGCSILPRIATGAVRVEGEGLDLLEAELSIVAREVVRLATDSELRVDYVVRRVGNLREAIRLAREAGEGGGILIE